MIQSAAFPKKDTQAAFAGAKIKGYRIWPMIQAHSKFGECPGITLFLTT